MLIPSALFRGEKIDRRSLFLEIRFSGVAYSELVNIAKESLCFINSVFADRFFAEWSLMDKSFNFEKIQQYLDTPRKPTSFLSFYADANVLSPVVFDRRSYRRYCRENGDILTSGKADCSFSNDYFDQYSHFFRETPPESMKERLLQWFSLPNRIDCGEYYGNDAAASFSGSRYYSDGNTYYGTMQISIKLFCARDELSTFSEQFLSFARTAAEKHDTVNAIVALTSMPMTSDCSPHRWCFSQLPKGNVGECGRTYFPAEWYPYEYLCGAEWANILSKRAQKHLPYSVLSGAADDWADIEVLPNKSAIVKLKKDIEKIDVADLANMKRFLYPALVPGELVVEKSFMFPNSRFLMVHPRPRWERIAIFSDEIIETKELLIYRHACDSCAAEIE